MAKKQDFASKVLKQQQQGEICQQCGNAYTFLKKVESYYSEESGSWKFATKNLKICSCNEKEVYS
ncbi:MAG: hypothetical protein D6748_07770 [Calditrichaeota bacterium]|nr:MAG: hypothetical protein D6748_07770 [Calditrichota bacterium]